MKFALSFFCIHLVSLFKVFQCSALLSYKSDDDRRQGGKIVFDTRPYDYKIDLPSILRGWVPPDLKNFNPYMASYSITFTPYFMRNYFEMFKLLYPGLENVPIHLNDVEGLIIFGVLHLASDDRSFLTADFLLMIEELSMFLENSLISQKLASIGFDDHRSLTKSAAMEKLFELAVQHNLVYTVEAFFATKKKAFTTEILLLAIESASHSGDSSLARRIASELDFDTCQSIFSSAASGRSWPQHENTAIFYDGSSGHILKSITEKYDVSSFKMQNIIAEGTYGSCWKIVSMNTGKQYALKYISKKRVLAPRPHRILRLQKEVMIQQSLSHEGIVRLYKTFEDKRNVYMIMELCSDNLWDLAVHRRHVFESEASHIFCQILSALEYLHRHGIIHRDIKPENLLINEPGMVVKIADFGLSTYVPQPGGKVRSYCGSDKFMAPEILKGVPYSFEVDIWSVGVSLYWLLSKEFPFYGESDMKLLRNILSDPLSFPKTIEFTYTVKDFIRMTLTPNPEERITVAEMKSHEFIAGV